MKSKQCPIEQEHKQEALAELGSLEEGGVIELYFGDESGFCNVPVVARAWQFRDEEIRRCAAEKQKIECFWVSQSGMRGANVDIGQSNHGAVCS